MEPTTHNIGGAEPLIVNRFLPEKEIVATVIVAPAMGTTQQYYQAFACWLSERGFQVITFDYTGMGASQTRALKTYQLNILDWAMNDCSKVLAQAIEWCAESPLYWLGHSLGGQIFPLVKGIEKVTKVVTIASGTGYWKRNTPALRRKVWWLWYLMVPILLPTFGYFPGKRLGMVGDLPKNVMAQWRRWCMHPEYCVGVEALTVRQAFEGVKLPIRSFALKDDEMLSHRNIHDLFAMFGSDNKRLSTLSPSDYKLHRIGHLGFFRQDVGEKVWASTILEEIKV